MNATTGNVSAFVWDEVNFTSTGTTVDYHFNGDIGVSTVPSFTVEKENIEIELNWIEPLDLIMDAFFCCCGFCCCGIICLLEVVGDCENEVGEEIWDSASWNQSS